MHTQKQLHDTQIDEVKALLQNHYHLTGDLHPLAGEVDQNFLLKDRQGQSHLVKLSTASATELEFQMAMMEHLQVSQLPFALPRLVKSNVGNFVPYKDGHLRVHTWVPGRMMAEVNPRSTNVLRQWSAVCGHMSQALDGFDHPAAHKVYRWDPLQTLESRSALPHIVSSDRQALVSHFWEYYESKQTAVSLLRKSVNHNDLHEHNILCTEDTQHTQVSGVIDLGDAVYTATVCEVAIASAYAAMHMPDPVAAIAEVVAGCHAVYSLQEAEIDCLYALIVARLLITVASAAEAAAHKPDHAYLQVSAEPAWQLLAKLRAVSPTFATATWRAVLGWEPVPKKKAYADWLSTTKQDLRPVMDLDSRSVRHIDLSVGSTVLGQSQNIEDDTLFDRTISRWLEDQAVDVAYGGYLEPRAVYTTDAYLQEGNQGARWRTVHLGLDLWTAEKSTVYAPLAGTVHAVANHTAKRDYGPVIILRHEVSSELTFYTLYGHLSEDSLCQWKIGDEVTAGTKIAEIGHRYENGTWPPHLHFQIMLDMLHFTDDYPGACFPEEVDVWRSLCPDPKEWFALQQPTTGLHAKEIIAKRKTYLGRSLSLSYTEPLHMVRGAGPYLYSAKGRRYLDTVNNVAHVGHENPRVVRAAQRQMSVLNTNTRYLHEQVVLFAEELAATMPNELSVVHFVNSGSEANELALRMMKTITGQDDVIAVEVGYHGNTNGTIDISSYKFDAKGGSGCPPQTHIVPMPDTYRGLYRDEATAGKLYASHVAATIAKVHQQGKGIKGFIAESILSCGGQIVLPDGYLAEVYAAVRAAGGLCVADEVQVGIGRVGSHYWGFELQGVVPDIVTIGKPLGNGHPLATVVTTVAVADAFANGMEYFNTFGGNPVSCAIGREVLAVVRDENLQQQALEKGALIQRGLKVLQQRYPTIGDVRGEGLFLGFELVTDPVALTPAARQASYLADRMRQRGILMSTDGPHHNVLKIKPPMVISEADIDRLLYNLELVLAEDFMQI